MAKRKNPEDQPDENLDKNNESEDNFGLPDIEYKPLEESGDEVKNEAGATGDSSAPEEVPEVPPTQPHERYVYTPPVEEKSKAPMVIGLVIGAVILVAAFLIYKYVYIPAKEKEKIELTEKQKKEQERKRKAEEERLAKEREDARQRAIADSIAAANAKPIEGAIETLTERTRRYYVVISSAIDDDLVMDYAKKLSKEGVGTKIIPPFGSTKFYRLAIADHETYALAQTNADNVKDKYGSEVWVVRY